MYTNRSNNNPALLASALAVAIIGQAILVKADYVNPPTWSPMTMLNVSYDTTNSVLSVVDEEIKLPGVYPILTSAPDGTFDPTKPWSVLNGTAYSRRLGWWDPNSTKTDGSAVLDKIHATYGSDACVWIQCMSQSPELNSYLAVGKYGVNATGATNADGSVVIDPSANGYSGIFGTAGSSSNWLWDGKMDHNTYAVRLSDITATDQLFSATYRVYVGDPSGNDIAPSAGTIETWTWQAPATIPEPTTLCLMIAGGLLVIRFARVKG